MQGASPLASPGAEPERRLQPLPIRCQAGTCLFGRLPTLSLAYFPAPIPLTPFPGGEGGDYKFISPGATAPGTPALNRLRHLQPLLIRFQAGGVPPALPAQRALAVPCGGLPFSSPAHPAFGLLSCPLSPRPPSRREGGDFRLFHARGFAPCIPALNRLRHL